MPVELPMRSSNATLPEPPREITWLGLFIAFMLGGVVLTLLTWPKDEPTGTAWFWVRLLAFPALAWSVLYGLRLHYYEQETQRLSAEGETLEADRTQAIRFASEPLAVLANAYLCELGSGDAAKSIVEGVSILQARSPRTGGKIAHHTSLTMISEAPREKRFRSCLVELFNQIDRQLCNIPDGVPFDVLLHLPDDGSQPELLNVFEECWNEFGYRRTRPKVLPTEHGLFTLDEWLDIRGGPGLEKLSLFIAVQLHDTPPDASAEAAVALLLAWAPLAERRGLQSLALLHRPVAAEESVTTNDSVAKALLWGKATPSETVDLWQVGLDGRDKSALLQATADLSLGIGLTDGFSGVHDIDVALGYPGIAGEWLAVALAIEHVTHRKTPQLVACRGGVRRLAVIQPMTQADGMESRT